MKKFTLKINKNKNNKYLIKIKKCLDLNKDIDETTGYPNQKKMILCGNMLTKHALGNNLQIGFCLIKITDIERAYLNGGAISDIQKRKKLLDFISTEISLNSYIGCTSIGIVLHLLGTNIEKQVLDIFNTIQSYNKKKQVSEKDKCIEYKSYQAGYVIFPDDFDNPSVVTHSIISKYVAISASEYSCMTLNNSYIRRFLPIYEIKIIESLQVEKALSNSINNCDFDMYFQSQHNLETGEMIGAEALTRWDKYEVLSPTKTYEYIKIIEGSNYIKEFTKQSFEKLVNFIVKTKHLFPKNFKFGFNLSPSLYKHDDFDLFELIKNKIEANSSIASRLIIEVTESAYTDNKATEMLAKSLSEIKNLGVSISIDDLGSGNRSLRLLTAQLPNYIKLDMTMTREYCKQKNQHSFIGDLIQSAQKNDLNVICEGIETQEQKEILISKGIKLGQGYLFSCPIPEEQFLSNYKQQLVS